MYTVEMVTSRVKKEVRLYIKFFLELKNKLELIHLSIVILRFLIKVNKRNSQFEY